MMSNDGGIEGRKNPTEKPKSIKPPDGPSQSRRLRASVDYVHHETVERKSRRNVYVVAFRILHQIFPRKDGSECLYELHDRVKLGAVGYFRVFAVLEFPKQCVHTCTSIVP
jgi:hypothetical protein